MHSGPNLLVQWEPRWRGFLDSVRPALRRSGARLALECEPGARVGTSSAASMILHLLLVAWLATLTTQQVRATGYIPVEEFSPEDYEVVYYAAKELPQMVDAGGAQAGVSGKSGGREMKSETEQVIRIARGPGLMKSIVDAPDIKLPQAANPANLIIPGASRLPVPPTPEVSRTASALDVPAGAIQPQPRVSAQARTIAPLPLGAVQPSAEVKRDRMPALTVPAALVQPQPNVRRDGIAAVPAFATEAVAPQNEVRRTEMARLALPQNIAVVPPAPATAARVGNPKLEMPTGLAVAPPAELPRGGERLQQGVADSIARGIIPPGVSVVTVGSFAGERSGAGNPSGGATGAGGRGGSGQGPTGAGVVASAAPGGGIGRPEGGGAGSLAMSPSGGAVPGFGGSGGGGGIGKGSGTGSGNTGTGPGAAKVGTGLGTGAPAWGITLGAGPGGSGSGAGQPGGIAGVTIMGSTAHAVALPSFGADGAAPSNPRRGPAEKRKPPAVTIIATSRSGGALGRYGMLKGMKVYTVYIETAAGLVAVQFSSRARGATADFQQDLTPPEPERADLPAEMKKASAVASCLLDRTGQLKNVRLLEYSGVDQAKFAALLGNWRMRPVLAGDEPVEVDVILALNASTN